MLNRDDLGLSLSERRWRTIAAVGHGVCARAARQRATIPTASSRDSQEPRCPLAGGGREWRQNGLGAQILADLGVRRLRVIGTPRRFLGLSGFGLEVVDYAPSES
jgi:3,4-dihydroxy 2-butanone 4-phosphate synthase/GTP cyclohydrolase II